MNQENTKTETKPADSMDDQDTTTTADATDSTAVDGASATPIAATAKAAPPARGTSLLAVLALLLAVAVAVGGYFIWHEVKRLDDWQQQTLGQIDNRSQTLTQRLDSFKDRLDADLAETERSRRKLEEQQRQLADAQDGLENSMTVMRAQVGRSQNDWSIAEVQYLLQVANQRLQLARDIPTAIAALQSADQRLQSLADPGYNPVRKQIAAELAALQSIEAPDLPGITLTLSQLTAQVDSLPLQDSQPLPQFEPSADAVVIEEELSTTDWKKLPGIIWDEIKRLVVVRRNDEPVGPMLAPDQRYFLYQNLRLQLDAARLAALQGVPDSYTASLNLAGTWLSEYFDTEAASVKAMQNELARLAAIEVRPELPDISASLRKLKQQMRLSDLAVDAAKQRATDKQPAKPAAQSPAPEAPAETEEAP